MITESMKTFVFNHPFISGTAVLFSLALLILRKIHYKFIVFPSIDVLIEM